MDIVPNIKIALKNIKNDSDYQKTYTDKQKYLLQFVKIININDFVKRVFYLFVKIINEFFHISPINLNEVIYKKIF